jgi:uncharacterized protein YutE (UPF0331/DUF86 family)
MVSRSAAAVGKVQELGVPPENPVCAETVRRRNFIAQRYEKVDAEIACAAVKKKFTFIP